MVEGGKSMNERQKRTAIMRQFELQMPKYPLQILERLTNFRYRIFEEERGVEMLATVLASSFDFYEHRLNLVKHGFNLIICQKHNSAVPVSVLELNTSLFYEPGAIPDGREGRKRRTPDERKILVSQIIIGSQSGMYDLEDLSERSRLRYLKLREEYLQPKIGRPWAS
jgi:hypothetical protein